MSGMESSARLSGLSPDQRRRCAALVERVEVEAGACLWRCGDPADRLVLDGSAGLEVETGPGRFARLEPGALVGHVQPWLPGERRTRTLRSWTDGDLLCLDASALRVLAEEASPLADRLLEEAVYALARRLRRLLEQGGPPPRSSSLLRLPGWWTRARPPEPPEHPWLAGHEGRPRRVRAGRPVHSPRAAGGTAVFVIEGSVVELAGGATLEAGPGEWAAVEAWALARRPAAVPVALEPSWVLDVPAPWRRRPVSERIAVRRGVLDHLAARLSRLDPLAVPLEDEVRRLATESLAVQVGEVSEAEAWGWHRAGRPG